MSRLLKEIDPDEFSDYSDEEEYYEDEDDQYYGEDGDDDYEEEGDDVEEEEQKTAVALPILSTAQKKQAAKKSAAKPKNTGAKNSSTAAKQKKFTLDDVEKEDNRANVKYVDIKEKEYYDNLLLTEEERLRLSKKMKTLDKIDFSLPIRESVVMYFDQANISKVKIVTINERWSELYPKISQMSVNDERERKNQRRLNNFEFMDHVYDTHGTHVSKFKTYEFPGDHPMAQTCLKRVHAASCTMKNKVWVHGGNNGKAVLNDFYSYDLTTQQLTHYHGIQDHHNFRINIPHMDGHQLIPVSKGGSDSLLVIGYDRRGSESRWSSLGPRYSFMGLFFIQDVNTPKNISCGARFTVRTHFNEPTVRWGHPVPRTVADRIPPKSHFSATLLGAGQNGVHNILIFGGCAHGSTTGSNTLHLISFDPTEMKTDNGGESGVYSAVTFTPSKSNWPSPRHGHAAVAVSGNLFVFGGRSSDKIYNDLWYFDSTRKAWTEIDIVGTVPPGLSLAGSFVYSTQTIMVYGGHRDDGVISNSIYSYNTGTRQWSIVKVRGHGSGKDSSPDNLQVSVYGAQVETSGYQMLRFGGKHSQTVKSDITVLSNIQDPGHTYSVSEYLGNVKRDAFFTDVIFRVRESLNNDSSDADEIEEIEGHRAIIYARCQFLTNLINESTNIILCESDDLGSVLSATSKVVVDIEECNSAVFKAYLNYLYTGELALSSVSNIEALANLCAKWCPDTHYPIIQELCNPTSEIKLTLAEAVLAQMEKDFETLINNPESSSDLVLVLGDGADDSCFIHVHKFILCRSAYFKNMLGSGMQESYSEMIELPQYDRNVMIEILRYCYTDKINLNFSNAVGSLIYSSLFQLPDIGNACRNLVGQCLTLDNVCAVMDIAEAYNDNALKRVCMPFMRDNFEELQHTANFLALPTDSRSKVAEMYQKKKKQSSKK